MSKELRLSELPVMNGACISRISCSCPIRRRLQDLGFVEGVRIECMGQSPLKDPRAYHIRGMVIALRQRDAACVMLDESSMQCAKGEEN